MIKFEKINYEYVQSKIPGLNAVYERYSDKIICMYLFGSINSGRATALSDIDIAILFDRMLNNEEMEFYRNKILEDLSHYFKTEEIDLINLNRAPLSVQYGVIKNKSNMYCKDFSKAADYENKTVLKYLDFKPYKDELNGAFVDALIAGGV